MRNAVLRPLLAIVLATASVAHAQDAQRERAQKLVDNFEREILESVGEVLLIEVPGWSAAQKELLERTIETKDMLEKAEAAAKQARSLQNADEVPEIVDDKVGDDRPEGVLGSAKLLADLEAELDDLKLGVIDLRNDGTRPTVAMILSNKAKAVQLARQTFKDLKANAARLDEQHTNLTELHARVRAASQTLRALQEAIGDVADAIKHPLTQELGFTYLELEDTIKAANSLAGVVKSKADLATKCAKLERARMEALRTNFQTFLEVDIKD